MRKPHYTMFLSIFLFLMIFAICSFGQVKFTPDYYHTFQLEGNLRQSSAIHITGADSSEKAYIAHIMELLDIPPNFELKVSDIPYVSAAIYHGRRYLLVNKDLMRDLTSEPTTNWANLYMVLHEIGHHVMGHTLAPSSNARQQDLLADEFAGLVMAKLGASRLEALSPFLHAEARLARSGNSAEQARMEAISKGWKRAGRQATNSGHRTTRGAGPNIKVNKPEKRFIIHETWIEHMVYDEAEKGISIHLDFEALGFQESRCKITALVYHSSGSPLMDQDYEYATSRGQVAAARIYTPLASKSRDADFALFIPYSQLHINSPYQHDLKVLVLLEDFEKQASQRGQVKSFWYKSDKSGNLRTSSKGDESIDARLRKEHTKSHSARE